MGVKKIRLTQGKFALIDEEDYERVSRFKWYWGSAGTTGGYASRATPRDCNGKQKGILMHRFILEASPTQMVDHRNRKSLDNRRSNLRKCTRSQNNRNSKGRGKYKGIRTETRGNQIRYQARIWYKNKRVCLGSFKTKKEAAEGYDKAAKKYYGEFACLNFP